MRIGFLPAFQIDGMTLWIDLVLLGVVFPRLIGLPVCRGIGLLSGIVKRGFARILFSRLSHSLLPIFGASPHTGDDSRHPAGVLVDDDEIVSGNEILIAPEPVQQLRSFRRQVRDCVWRGTEVPTIISKFGRSMVGPFAEEMIERSCWRCWSLRFAG
ncbi:hypothetical protein IVB24_30840 [Bradyrhizobium sp. 192]|nr:hypothetical protein IVB24_30840 [Bradyrhizobium sp. 192]